MSHSNSRFFPQTATMSLEVLEGKPLAQPPGGTCLPDSEGRLKTVPLTPASDSLVDEPHSDISNHDLGDTCPSSIEDPTSVFPRSPNTQKVIRVGLDASTALSPRMGSLKHKHLMDRVDTAPSAPLNRKASCSYVLSVPVASPALQPRLNLQPHLTIRRHTNTVPTLSRKSLGDTPSGVRNKNLPAQWSLLKDFPGRSSVVDSEFSRMRSSLKRRTTLRRRDFLDSDNVLLGNKIDEGHRNFVMAYNMLTGIRVSVSSCSGVMKELHDNDFRAFRKLTFKADGSELTPSSKYDFRFKDYCPEVFRELRLLFGIDPADYLMSITGKYILSEFGSPGKSGSFFYYSRDFRFIIKTIHYSEHKQLRRILKEYYLHVKENPNTLISQFYGLHRLKVHGGIKKIHFIVMNNLFPPHRDIHLKYDIKGSTWGRYTHVEDEGEGGKELADYTLKDLNWLQRKDQIKFGPEKRQIFSKQLEAEVAFLKRINVMDYSLLLGVHDVKKGNSLTTAKLSVYEPKSEDRSELLKTNPRDIDRGVDLPNSVFPGRSKYIFYGHDGGIRATNEANEPLPEIYYLGIIDCLTNYSWKKKLETFWRSLSHKRRTISAIPAHEYGDRFLAFIKKGLSSSNLKKS